MSSNQIVIDAVLSHNRMADELAADVSELSRHYTRIAMADECRRATPMSATASNIAVRIRAAECKASELNMVKLGAECQFMAAHLEQIAIRANRAVNRQR